MEGKHMGQTPQDVQDAVKNWAESGWAPMRRLGTPITVDGGSSVMNPDFPLAPQVPA
jgi:hypothetical protein